MTDSNPITPKICQGCYKEHFHPSFKTCDACREQNRSRRIARQMNVEPRLRGRPPLDPAGYRSQLHRFLSFDLGPMDQICSDCGAKHWNAELPSNCTANNVFWMSCCKAGAVKIELLKTPPTFLKELYDDISARGRNFKDNLRRYNATFAFTSLACTNFNQGIPNMPFQIQGQMYHCQGPLTPSTVVPRYAQLYILDPQYAASVRFAFSNRELDEHIIEQLTAMIHEHNPFVELYRSAHELLQTANDTDASFVRIAPSMKMELIAGSDRRTENLPTADEVAGMIPNEHSDAGFRDIRIYLRESRTVDSYTAISQTHALYMPLHYTLLFPNGDLGWNWGLKLYQKDERLTQRAYYRFRLHQRASEYPTIFLAKRLFQQYLVDVWAICDQSKLDWIKIHQSSIRADLYNGLEDALLREDVDPASLGRRVILPSSHVGSPRFMAKIYQNSMAIVRYFGKPTLFITFTANPRWEEIQRELLPGQNASDRPDLVARVFDMKVKELLKDLKVKEIFGTYKGLVRTIEYQKRGLPHLHLLLFLDARFKVDRNNTIDQIISAEIPSKNTDPELYEIITKNMVHGPCGDVNPKSPCMIKDNNGNLKCSKGFPKLFMEETVVSEDGYPKYKRSRNMDPSCQYSVRNPLNHGSSRFEIDNRWIVPYNPYLSKKYKCHINVECCQSVKAIKYINKYVYKGSDRTTIKISDSNNEIDRYLNGRYIGPTEAFARIFEYKSHEEDPTVATLALHLEDEQPVYFPEDATPFDIRHILNNSKSMLTAYFHYYDTHQDAPKYLYQDFPEYYVWKQKNKCWEPRKRGFAIGRIPYCSPNCGERYYLRLLLSNVPGAKSFQHLKTIDGHEYRTFKQACLKLHLIEDDEEWTRCFDEAIIFFSGSSLRGLFITALTFGELVDPVSLWITYRDSICDDLDHRLQQLFPQNEIYTTVDESSFYLGLPSLDYGLFLLQNKLKESGRSLEHYELPLYKHDWTDALNRSSTRRFHSSNILITEQLSYDVQYERMAYETKHALFNVDQKHAFDTIVSHVETQGPVDTNGACFFLHGAGGTGKTFVYNTICNYLRSKEKIVLCVASSGIAALLLSGGRTSHFRFKIPLEVNDSTFCHIPKNSDLAELLRQTALIIWDEVPMQNKLCFETVDRTLQDVCDKQDVLFGGIPVVLGGDFAQIPPVIKNGNRSAIVEASIKKSSIWNNVETINLTTNMRIRGTSSNDVHFKGWLNEATYSSVLQNTSITIPSYIKQTNSLNDFISSVYPPEALQNIVINPSLFCKSAILSTRNDTVDDLNEKVLNLMPGDSVTLCSADSVNTTDDVFPVSNEYLQTLNPPGLSPSKLILKVGCIVMLLRNLNPRKGLCNGTRLIVKEIGGYVLKVAVMNVDNSENEQIEFIPRIKLATKEDEYPFILTRKQFPIKLSFAMTINKSQGQSLTNVGIDLRYSVFTHGQLYVALSRSTNIEGITVLHREDSSTNTVENIVYPELLT